MARITLKAPPKPATAPTGGLSSRAKRAQMRNQPRRPPAAKPVEVAAAPATPQPRPPQPRGLAPIAASRVRDAAPLQ
jgi:hypothetical protein